MDENKFPNLEEYLGSLENLAYNAYYDLDLSNAPNIVLRPNGKGTHSKSEMPVIYGEYKSDEGAFWFEPRMEFPRYLSDNTFTGNYHSRLEDWTNAAKLADYLLEAIWYIDVED